MLNILDLYPMNIGGWNSPGEVIKDDVLTRCINPFFVRHWDGMCKMCILILW